MKTLTILTIISLLSVSSFGAGRFIASVKFKIGLGFDVVSENVKGSFKKSGNKYVAKKIKASIRKMTTDNEARDEHMKDRFGKNRTIVIERAIASGGKGVAIVSMNGVKKKERFTYKETGKKLKINMNVSMADYKLVGISYKDIVLKDTVGIAAEVDVE